MSVVLTLTGIGLIVVGLRDMFHTLLHPKGQGRLSGLVLRGLWRLSRASGHRLGSSVGPGAMVAVILLWVALQVLGWGLIYLPHVPDGFLYSPGVDPGDYSDLVQALYLSAVTMTTLGYGDVVGVDPWIRVATPLEALTGFGLLTAALTWFMQIYPPLSRRRSLALELKGLGDVGWAQELSELGPALVTRVLDATTVEVSKVRIDFAQHSGGFYFKEKDPDLSLARQMSHALQMRDAALASELAPVRSSGRRLTLAIEQLCAELDGSFLHTGGDVEEVLAAYAAEHEPPRRR